MLVWFVHLECPVGTQQFRTRGEKIQTVIKMTSCNTARAGGKENAKHVPQQNRRFSEYGKKHRRLVKEADMR